MGNLQTNLLASMKAVNLWQENLIRNAQGLMMPGYNRRDLRMGGTTGGAISSGQTGSNAYGSRNGITSGDTLSISGSTMRFQQGDIRPANSDTSLAVQGQGFFVVAENLRPGARLFLTRNGEFHYDASGRLVNNQGLFVVGGGGRMTDPPTPVMNPGDGTVRLGDISLARVSVPSNLEESGYGPLVYQVNGATGPIQPYANGSAEVGFVQANSLEFVNRTSAQLQLTIETTFVTQTFKMLKDTLDNYNRMTDDVLSTVK